MFLFPHFLQRATVYERFGVPSSYFLQQCWRFVVHMLRMTVHGNRKRMMVHQHRAVGVLVKVFCDPETFARAQVHLQLLYPPHNGFGGDEDSLGSASL